MAFGIGVGVGLVTIPLNNDPLGEFCKASTKIEARMIEIMIMLIMSKYNFFIIQPL